MEANGWTTVNYILSSSNTSIYCCRPSEAWHWEEESWPQDVVLDWEKQFNKARTKLFTSHWVTVNCWWELSSILPQSWYFWTQTLDFGLWKLRRFLRLVICIELHLSKIDFNQIFIFVICLQSHEFSLTLIARIEDRQQKQLFLLKCKMYTGSGLTTGWRRLAQ